MISSTEMRPSFPTTNGKHFIIKAYRVLIIRLQLSRLHPVNRPNEPFVPNNKKSSGIARCFIFFTLPLALKR